MCEKKGERKTSYMKQLFWGRVNWPSYSVVLQRCLLSPNQCEILKFQEGTNELCDPCTVFVVFYLLALQYSVAGRLYYEQHKCVLLLLYPKPITLIFCIMFHKISRWQNAPFLFWTFILFLKKKRDLWCQKPDSAMSTMTEKKRFEGMLLHFFHDIVQHYYTSHVTACIDMA